MSIESMMPPNHLILCHPLLLLPSVFPNTRVSSNESVLCIRWPKYWSFSFSISPSNEYSELIFRMDWLDLFAVQGTLKSPATPWFKSISFSALSFLYRPTLTSVHDYWKNHIFDWMDLCSKVTSLLFNKLSRFVRDSLVAQMVKRMPMMRETQVQSLSHEDPLEKEMATHSSTLA